MIRSFDEFGVLRRLWAPLRAAELLWRARLTPAQAAASLQPRLPAELG